MLLDNFNVRFFHYACTYLAKYYRFFGIFQLNIRLKIFVVNLVSGSSTYARCHVCKLLCLFQCKQFENKCILSEYTVCL